MNEVAALTGSVTSWSSVSDAHGRCSGDVQDGVLLQPSLVGGRVVNVCLAEDV